jgi:hypothetical protein
MSYLFVFTRMAKIKETDMTRTDEDTQLVGMESRRTNLKNHSAVY